MQNIFMIYNQIKKCYQENNRLVRVQGKTNLLAIDIVSTGYRDSTDLHKKQFEGK